MEETAALLFRTKTHRLSTILEQRVNALSLDLRREDLISSRLASLTRK